MNFIKKITDQIDKYMHYIELQVLIYLMSVYACFILYLLIHNDGFFIGILILLSIPYFYIVIALFFLAHFINIKNWNKHLPFSINLPVMYKCFFYINFLLAILVFFYITSVCLSLIL